MTYSKKELLFIGKTIFETEPDKAKSIVENIQPAVSKDLNKINEYFISYCTAIDSQPNNHIGRLYNREKSEANKVFIGAMSIIYNDQRSLLKTIAEILDKKQPLISRHFDEVKFRYLKDIDFKTKVDNILKIFL